MVNAYHTIDSVISPTGVAATVVGSPSAAGVSACHRIVGPSLKFAVLTGLLAVLIPVGRLSLETAVVLGITLQLVYWSVSVLVAPIIVLTENIGLRSLIRDARSSLVVAGTRHEG